jgi:hypothetical protein
MPAYTLQTLRDVDEVLTIIEHKIDETPVKVHFI